MYGYDEREEYIIEFYVCSLKNDFKSFGWESMTEHFTPELQNKLDEHGQGTEEAFRNFLEDMYGDFESLVPAEFTCKTIYVCFSESDVVDAVLSAMFERYKETFNGMFDHLKEFIDKMENIAVLTLEKKIQLFDNIIHAQHVTGDIFEDLDTEDLKAAAQEMVNCED